MAAARGVLQRNIPMLYTASRACLQHPDVAAYKANRDLIYKQLQHAVSGISNAAQATATEDSALGQPGGAGELACALNSFDVSNETCMPMSFLTVPNYTLNNLLKECIPQKTLQDIFVVAKLRRDKIYGLNNGHVHIRKVVSDFNFFYMKVVKHRGHSSAVTRPLEL